MIAFNPAGLPVPGSDRERIRVALRDTRAALDALLDAVETVQQEHWSTNENEFNPATYEVAADALLRLFRAAEQADAVLQGAEKELPS